MQQYGFNMKYNYIYNYEYNIKFWLILYSAKKEEEKKRILNNNFIRENNYCYNFKKISKFFYNILYFLSLSSMINMIVLRFNKITQKRIKIGYKNFIHESYPS